MKNHAWLGRMLAWIRRPSYVENCLTILTSRVFLRMLRIAQIV